ncbi:MAG: hypothetical protein KatS3mg101_1095 [Patescibacteria group bacterium]|nr:MAG: hypothetical protein KatS3mg101_1095 [Patescibacteria group bacterium]
MARPPKEKRNKQLVELRAKDPKTYTFRELARIFNIDIRAAWEIYNRDKSKYTKNRR